jgi:hypothetical protein
MKSKITKVREKELIYNKLVELTESSKSPVKEYFPIVRIMDRIKWDVIEKVQSMPRYRKAYDFEYESEMPRINGKINLDNELPRISTAKSNLEELAAEGKVDTIEANQLWYRANI